MILNIFVNFIIIIYISGIIIYKSHSNIHLCTYKNLNNQIIDRLRNKCTIKSTLVNQMSNSQAADNKGRKRWYFGYVLVVQSPVATNYSVSHATCTLASLQCEPLQVLAVTRPVSQLQLRSLAMLHCINRIGLTNAAPNLIEN